MDLQVIERFSSGGEKLRAAMAGLGREEALIRCRPGKWSIQELVVHLADSDAIAIDRMKRVLTEDNPTLLCADEGAYVDRLHCHEQSLQDAVTLFDVGRRQFGRVLRALDESDFERCGTHDVMGRLTLAHLVEGYADHLDHHLGFLEAKRANLGEPPD